MSGPVSRPAGAAGEDRGRGRTAAEGRPAGALVLTRAQVARLLDPAALLARLRPAFAAYSVERAVATRRIASPLSAPAPADAAAMVVMPGVVPGIPAYTVKVHAKFPGREPAVKGVIALHDLGTGDLLALMDSTHITALRTGLAGALAADVLARRDAGSVAVVGAGVQGRVQLRGLALVRGLRAVRVYDTLPGRAERLCAELQPEFAVPLRAASSLDEVLDGADIVVASTWSRTPFLFRDSLPPGAHVTTLGADQPGKREVGADLIRAAMFVCDDRDLAAEMGAVAGAGLGPEAVDAELGEVIAGRHPGRVSDDQITVFGSVGLAFQDLVAAWLVYGRAVSGGVGRRVDLLG